MEWIFTRTVMAGWRDGKLDMMADNRAVLENDTNR